MNKIVEFVKTAKETEGKLAKEAVLEDLYNSALSPGESLYLTFVINKQINFGIKFDPSWCNNEGAEDIGEAIKVLAALADRKNNKIPVATTKDMLRETCKNNGSLLIQWALDKTFDCGLSTTIQKKFRHLLPPKISMMKCEPANAKTLKNLEFPALAQVKIDAMRVNAIVSDNSCSYITYNETPFDIKSPNLSYELRKTKERIQMEIGHHSTIYIDGELLFLDEHGKYLPRKISNGLANRLLKNTLPTELLKNIRIVVWDFITGDMMNGDDVGMSNIERFETLSRAVGDNEYVSMVPHRIVSDVEESSFYASEMIKEGEEGIIVKCSQRSWEGKRSKYCVKFKAERENELRVIDITPGTRKYEGMIGSLVCASSDGLLSVNVSGLTDEERIKDDWLGKIVTVRYNEVITDKNSGTYSLFLPRLVECRIDKNEADTLQTILST